MESFSSFALATGLIGGLALFLYGMSVMSDALTKAAGGRLESILTRITANRWIAYFFGILITAVVQSSSASTVMLVGLVNAGMMTLSQGVNLILGANLGTTFTAWLLSLNAISSDNMLINMFKPTSFTPFLALIGMVLQMFSHKEGRKNAGKILIGFSVLMYGMTMMSSAVAPLKNVPSFTSFLTKFNNPLLGLFVGIGFTMIIQSSAGTIGVVQALSASVAISYGIAIPVVVGAEVGTCITAILSSVGAGKNGKRAALMHLYFNVIKASLFMILFYTLNAFLHFAFLQHQAGMAGVAMVHTMINLVATPLFVPISGILVKLAEKTIPVDEKEKKEAEKKKNIAILDPRFLHTPSFAVAQAKIAAMEMANKTKECFYKASHLLENYDPEQAAEATDLEEQIDHYEDQLGTYLVKINAHHLSPQDSHELSILLHCINDFERISDHSRNIKEVFENMQPKKNKFSDRAVEELTMIRTAVEEILNMAVRTFQTEDLKLAARIEPLEEVIDGLHMEIKQRHIKRLRKGKCTIDLGFDLADLCTDFERIADHCSNVGVCIQEVSEGGFDTHEYLEMLKKEKNAQFEAEVSRYERKYRLPRKKDAEDEVSEIGDENKYRRSKQSQEKTDIRTSSRTKTEQTAAQPKKEKPQGAYKSEKARKAASWEKQDKQDKQEKTVRTDKADKLKKKGKKGKESKNIKR